MSRPRTRFVSPFDRARNAALRLVARPFNWMSPTARFILGFAFLVIITTLLLARTYTRTTVEPYKEGDVVVRTIIAPADIDGIDIREAEKRRAAAREATPPVFRYDPTLAEKAAQSFRTAWEETEKQLAARNGNQTAEPIWRGEGEAPLVARALVAHHFDHGDLQRLTNFIRDTGQLYVYQDNDAPLLEREILLVNSQNTSGPSLITISQGNRKPLSQVHQELKSRLAKLNGWTQEQQNALASAILPLIKPNLIYDQAAAQSAREAAALRVEPITISLKRNQVIAREGDKVTEHMLTQFAALRAYGGHTNRQLNHILGLLFIVGAVFWVAWKFTEHRSTVMTLSKSKAFALVGSAVVVQTILMRVGFTLSDSIASQSMRAPLSDPALWSFAIPFAAASLLVVLLVDTQLALITGLVTSFFAGLLSPLGMPMALYAMVACAAAIYGIRGYRERQSVTLAGLVVGGISALMAVALLSFSQRPLTLNTILLAVGCALLGGLLTVVFTAGGLPVNESVFGILTDVKLLELSNADLPVLGQLALRAPGTNQHSHAVGQLAEEACRAVGANPLLARIGALYHDIGKTAAPEYFVENQQGANPHDRLKPTQSARIIIAHVTYGLKLAHEIGLPNQIADFIPQHHGTRTLHFFLRKAQAHAAPGEEVDETEFRYPGPKPQFKESAIMMIADSCEAAARSLERPDPENIRLIVNKIVDAIVTDGQLDECDLTLRQLMNIRESIVASLTAIYHARIDYPGFNPPSLTGSLPGLPHPAIDSEERGVSYSRASEIPINKAGEVEDEAITRNK
jgi:putative nucleotidyltransferase with HDIG domain